MKVLKNSTGRVCIGENEGIKKYTSGAKGITLVALVITVIILLILAGVAISAIVGEDGIFSKAKLAGEKYNEASKNEAVMVNEILEYEREYKQIIGDGSYSELMGVNTPKLMPGMTPVAWDSSNAKITPKTEKEWYDYANKKWANATTADGSYWVWIPRYAYKIKSGLGTSTTGTIDIVFVDTNNKKGTTTYNTTYPSVTGNGMNDYVVHPAFMDGSGNSFANGEWDSNIAGFWVAKFEAGYAGGGKNDINNDVPVVDTGIKYTGTTATSNYYGTVTTNSTTMKYPVFMGQSFSYNYIHIGDMYNLARNLTKANNPYGLSNTATDSHLMKNSEWGAVAYLSHSQYGVNGENTVYINNVNINNLVSTINAVTGYAGASVSIAANSFSALPSSLGDSISNGTLTSYAWYTENGRKASSNNNITGVYDLNGGSWEYAAGYINNTGGASSRTSYGGTLVAGTDKYRRIYPHNSSSDTDANNWTAYKNSQSNTRGYGDALLETSSSGSGSTSWNGSFSRFPNATGPFLSVGGNYGAGTGAGLFAFSGAGGNAYSYYAFRVTLAG